MAVGCAVILALGAGCSKGRPPPVKTVDASPTPRATVIEEARAAPPTTPYRAKLATHGAELYLPPWFSATAGGYDLVVHFHGLGKLQEANLDRSQLDAAVITVNLGVSTDLYANAFRDPRSFPKLVAEAGDAIDKSGRAPGAKVNRIALSAWSAGFVSIAKIMGEPANAAKIDAVLIADGFFTSLKNVKKRIVNTASLTRFVDLAEAATRGEKLFAITHSSIPTVDYASTEETAAKLLELTSSPKTPSSTIGPRDMHEIYSVDRGGFHVHGYEGVTAGDHIKQIQGMGETMYPYLKARWERREAAAAP